MQPSTPSNEQNPYVPVFPSPKSSIIQAIQKRLFMAVSSKKNQTETFSTLKDQAKSKQTPVVQQNNKAQCDEQDRQLPQLLDPHKTKQTRQKHALLRNTIQTSIQQILNLYKSRNKQMTPEQVKCIQNEVFNRFAFIYTEMNELKGNIQSTINFLNEDANVNHLDRNNTPNKRIITTQGRISEQSQSYEQQSMKEQLEAKKNSEPFSPNYGHASLEERFQPKAHPNSMQLEK